MEILHVYIIWQTLTYSIPISSRKFALRKVHGPTRNRIRLLNIRAFAAWVLWTVIFLLHSLKSSSCCPFLKCSQNAIRKSFENSQIFKEISEAVHKYIVIGNPKLLLKPWEIVEAFASAIEECSFHRNKKGPTLFYIWIKSQRNCWRILKWYCRFNTQSNCRSNVLFQFRALKSFERNYLINFIFECFFNRLNQQRIEKAVSLFWASIYILLKFLLFVFFFAIWKFKWQWNNFGNSFEFISEISSKNHRAHLLKI